MLIRTSFATEVSRILIAYQYEWINFVSAKRRIASTLPLTFSSVCHYAWIPLYVAFLDPYKVRRLTWGHRTCSLLSPFRSAWTTKKAHKQVWTYLWALPLPHSIHPLGWSRNTEWGYIVYARTLFTMAYPHPRLASSLFAFANIRTFS